MMPFRGKNGEKTTTMEHSNESKINQKELELFSLLAVKIYFPLPDNAE
jgi:hypothetical protein